MYMGNMRSEYWMYYFTVLKPLNNHWAVGCLASNAYWALKGLIVGYTFKYLSFKVKKEPL